jgi:hypothetical protein
MNINAILAVLEVKGIISRAEGEKIAEHIANKPQSTMLSDAVEQIKEIVDSNKAALLETVAPAIEQKAQEGLSVLEDFTDEMKTDIEKAAANVKKQADKTPKK